MKIQEMKSEYRMQEMQKVIRARTESGLTVSEWCQENNFSEGSYYYWLKKIRERTIEEVETGNEIVQVPIMLQKTAERKIKPVRIKYTRITMKTLKTIDSFQSLLSGMIRVFSIRYFIDRLPSTFYTGISAPFLRCVPRRFHGIMVVQHIKTLRRST